MLCLNSSARRELAGSSLVTATGQYPSLRTPPSTGRVEHTWEFVGLTAADKRPGASPLVSRSQMPPTHASICLVGPVGRLESESEESVRKATTFPNSTTGSQSAAKTRQPLRSALRRAPLPQVVRTAIHSDSDVPLAKLEGCRSLQVDVPLRISEQPPAHEHHCAILEWWDARPLERRLLEEGVADLCARRRLDFCHTPL
eukprot:7155148-Prymnesium_polylepis.1